MLLCMLLLLPASRYTPRTVDALEINRVYTGEGKLRLTQILFWRWEPTVGWVCEGWRKAPRGTLRKTATGWRWEEKGTLPVESGLLWKSWTQKDREVHGETNLRSLHGL